MLQNSFSISPNLLLEFYSSELNANSLKYLEEKHILRP